MKQQRAGINVVVFSRSLDVRDGFFVLSKHRQRAYATSPHRRVVSTPFDGDHVCWDVVNLDAFLLLSEGSSVVGGACSMPTARPHTDTATLFIVHVHRAAHPYHDDCSSSVRRCRCDVVHSSIWRCRRRRCQFCRLMIVVCCPTFALRLLLAIHGCPFVVVPPPSSLILPASSLVGFIRPVSPCRLVFVRPWVAPPSRRCWSVAVRP